MHPVGVLSAMVMLMAGLGGCMDDDGREYGGIGITFMNERPEDGRFYYKIWSNEYPPNYTSPDGSVGTPGNKDGCGGQGHSGFCTQTVHHCSTPQKPHRDHGNHLPEVYLQVSLYELATTLSGRETAGEEIESKRWDGLECFKGYTLVLTQGPHVELYRCNDCRDGEYLGFEPLEPSWVR